MLYIFIFIFILLLGNASAKAETINILPIKDKPKYSILVDLVDCRLYLINIEDNKAVKSYPIAGGKPSTPSPIGTWTIVSKGEWDKGFGTRWMGLNVIWGKYGIHGTNKPLSIGGYASLGCIRMINKDVEELYRMVGYGTTVTIYGGPYDMFVNEFRTLNPGDTGADVYEVQRRLRDRDYYNGPIDGIYGEEMKAQVIKFRKDNKLKVSHTIDKEFYNALDIKAFE